MSIALPLRLFPDLPSIPAREDGILPWQAYAEFIRAGFINSPEAPISPSQIQPASIDLRLGEVAYRVRASFLPGRTATVAEKVASLRMHEMDLTKGAVLEKGCVYIVPLLEELRLPARIGGAANPKSSTGRLDIFTRLITDYAEEFETVVKGYSGKLYIEVSPRTFSVFAQTGISLNQLRLIRGRTATASSDTQLEKIHTRDGLVFSPDDTKERATIRGGLNVSIDLSGIEGELIGYLARHHAPLIDLRKIATYEIEDFWEPIHRTPGKTLILNPGDFYILASKEKIRVPPEFAAEMIPYDSSVGEFRIHYAGFFDPGFGYSMTGQFPGTRAVLEVRSHEVPFLMEDGQIVGRLVYEYLTDAPQKLYGSDLNSNYQQQTLALSKHFKRPRV